MPTKKHDLTTIDPLPFIIQGEWRDVEWHTADEKFKRNELLTVKERTLLMGSGQFGPRHHPFGCDAFCSVFGGKVMIFPDQETHDAWFAIPRS